MTDSATIGVEPTIDTSLVAASEIERTRTLIAGYQAGRMDGDSFRRFRLQNGIYGIRGQVDIQMVRVRIPLGRLTAAQLDGLGHAAETFATGPGHLTTRQDVQLYWVPLARVPDLLTDVGKVGLTTREASGNVVRNITADPFAGVAPDEVFDVRPYANAVARFWLRNPVSQNMPRKVKMAFSGSPADRAVTGMADIGLLAVIRQVDGQPRRGFQVLVGGGLGSSPQVGKPLEDWTPEANLLPTLDAIVRVFDRLGNRQTKAKARLKFLVEQLGIEAFRDLIFKERTALPLVQAQPYPGFDADINRIGWVTPQPAISPKRNGHHDDELDPSDYSRWLEHNVIRQRQPGYVAVSIAVPGGDITSSQFHALASVARQFARGEVFTTIGQNLVLRWVAEDTVRDLFRTLCEIGLGESGADGLWNVVSCPGADTCNTAITTSHRLALELGRRLREQPDLNLAQDLRGIDIKVSGCLNACGHHHIAAIGFHGGARRVNDRQTPHYLMLLGGRVLPGKVILGKPVTSIPAKRVPEAVERVIALYRAGRRDVDETFHDWVGRVGAVSLRGRFEDLRNLPDPTTTPELYRDWGQDFPFKVEVGEAECAV